jgi:hypothetical protein
MPFTLPPLSEADSPALKVQSDFNKTDLLGCTYSVRPMSVAFQKLTRAIYNLFQTLDALVCAIEKRARAF